MGNKRMTSCIKYFRKCSKILIATEELPDQTKYGKMWAVLHRVPTSSTNLIPA